MKFDLEKFIKDAKQVKLKKSEKDKLLHYLKAVVASELVRKPNLTSHNIWSNTFSYIKLTLSKPMPIIIILAILLSGGTSLAAQSSLPGNPLYPIKVEVNERVAGWFALSDQAKASWDAHLAEVRLQEAEKLAVENKLDNSTKVDIEENFERHAKSVAQRVGKFKSENTAGALEVNSDFRTSLNSHFRILDDIGVSLDGSVKAELDDLSAKVKKERDIITEDEDKNEGEARASSGIGFEEAAEGKLKATQHKIEEVKEFIERKKDKVGADAVVKAEAHLQLAENILAQGKLKLEAKDYVSAFLLFQKAKNIAQETKLLLEAKEDFERNDKDDNGRLSTTPSPTSSPTQSVSPSPSSSVSASPSPSSRLEVNSSTKEEVDHSRVRGRVKINIGF